jgi:hypothetical protein
MRGFTDGAVSSLDFLHPQQASDYKVGDHITVIIGRQASDRSDKS